MSFIYFISPVSLCFHLTLTTISINHLEAIQVKYSILFFAISYFMYIIFKCEVKIIEWLFLWIF